MRVHDFYSLLRYSPKHAVKTMTYSAHVAVLAGMCVFVRARLCACRACTCGRTGTYVLVQVLVCVYRVRVSRIFNIDRSKSSFQNFV